MGFFKKIFKEIDRGLDRRLGIDDPTIRMGIIIGAGALGGYYGGAALGGYVGGAYGGAAGGGVSAGISGINVAAAAGATGSTLGAISGGIYGASLASKALAKGGMTPSQVTGAVKPPSSFGGFALGAQERLRKRLALQMSIGKTNVTGGVRGFSQTVRPTLMTL